jgi:hypothetical protein
MKALLIKENGTYFLKGDGIPNPAKLDLDNCDEIFSSLVIDVKKLAEERFLGSDDITNYNLRFGFKEGFNKAMELNKDKVFTLEDMVKARNRGDWYSDEDWDNYIESLQQPTIAVVIVTEPMNIDEIREQSKGFLNANTNKPKLDSNGNLILRKL